MKKVILDVDTGIDDALAIIYAIMSKELDILGITTVAGNVDVDQATLNTLKVLKLLDFEEIPVYKGCAAPLIRGIEFTEGVHGEHGLAGELKEMEVKYQGQKHASDFIIEEVIKHKNELSIVLLAPETNMALALKKEPRIAEYIKEIVLMGGVVDGPGNQSPVAEFNIFKDPESAKIVFNSGIPIKMISLDLTRRATLSERQLLMLDRGSAVQNFIFKISRHYINKCSSDGKKHGCALHDPLAVAVTIDKSLVKTEKKRIDIETNSVFCDGQTVCDHNNRLGKPLNVRLAINLDYERFIESFMTTVKR